MGDSEKVLTEKTRISVSVTSWWHLAILVAVIVWWGALIKFSIDSTKDIADKALSQSQKNDQVLMNLQFDLRLFHQRYDSDMDRYIRDYNDPNRKR